MSPTATMTGCADETRQRVIGILDQGRAGPTFLAQGAIHGNEPGGILALKRVLKKLRDDDVQIHGRIVFCTGNLGALALEQRYVERDLNRSWLTESVERLEAQDPALDTAEDVEQRELIELYKACLADRKGPLVFIDLHSSSADGPPFTCMADTIPNRRIADAIPVPMILGLEECIDGAVMEFFNERGQIGVAVEGGRHDDPATVDNLESAVWLSLAASGVVARADIETEQHEQRLTTAARGVSHLVEIRYRHAITPEHEFRMVPGYVTFQPITKGELLADQKSGPVRAKENGMILLPLYQGQGEDGFFTCRRVLRFWFSASAWVRKIRLGRLLCQLPGINRDPEDRNTILANPRIARWGLVDLFHLLGYRRERMRGDLMAFSRRWSSPECYGVRPR